MANQTLGLGSAANDGTGDTLRAALDKVNDNFLEIYTLIGDTSALTTGISATASVVTLSSAVGTFTTLTPAASDGTALGSASLEFSDLFLADAAVINLGADQDTTLTHVADTGILLNSTRQLQFGDSGTYIHQSADGVLDLVADTEIEINATTIDINGAVVASGEIAAVSLDISGDVDVDGTLEADAITIDGVTLSETISDTVGAMVGSNTETGISVTYEDGDNTLDFVLGSSQTTISSLTNASLVVGRDADNDIDFATDNNIIFRAAGTDQIKLVDGALAPVTDNGVDLGTSSLEFKDAFFDGTVTSDAFAGPLTGEVTGNASTATILATARTIGGTSFDGSANIAVALASVGTAVTVADESSDTTCFPLFTTAATGDLPPKSGSNLTFNSSSGLLTATAFAGDLTGDVTGTADVATVATTVTITDNESTNEDNAIIFTAGGDVDGGNIGLESDGTLTYNPSTGKITATGFIGALTGNVTGNASGTAATVTGAAQTNITSVGTLTALQVDNININTNTISTTAGTDLLITPVAGQQIVLDGTIIIDAGVVTGATSITSTAFVGDITGDVTGNSDTATTSTNVTVADESSDTTCFPLFATAATGNLPPKSGSNLTFNSSSGLLTATSLAGTVTTATQNSITTATGLVSVGALNSGTITSGFGNIDTGSSTITTTGLISGGSLDIDNVLINGTTIGHTDDTDLITLADGVVTVAGEISVTTLDIGAVNVTSTAAELNILDASAGNAAVASDVATNAGAVTSNTAKISHTITLNANLADDAIHADIVVTSDKCLATSVVMASSSLAVGINIHTIAAGSFKVSITNLTGAQMDDDSTLVVNYRII